MQINMDEKLCWPDLPERFDLALRDAVGFVLDRFNVIGIVAAGTILRGTADATSDLDIYVIHREPFRQRIQRFSRNVPTEIFVNPPWTVRSYLSREHADGRPITAHMLATGHVILSIDPIVDELRAEAAEWLAKPSRPSPAQIVMDRYLAATLYEDARDIAKKDPSTALLILSQSVTAMISFWYRSNGHFIPRTKEFLSSLESLNQTLGRDAQRFFIAPPEERWLLAERIADQTIGVRGFFEWESAPQVMTE
jgi:predicted nucleotidyltransferase